MVTHAGFASDDIVVRTAVLADDGRGIAAEKDPIAPRRTPRPHVTRASAALGVLLERVRGREIEGELAQSLFDIRRLEIVFRPLAPIVPEYILRRVFRVVEGELFLPDGEDHFISGAGVGELQTDFRLPSPKAVGQFVDDLRAGEAEVEVAEDEVGSRLEVVVVEPVQRVLKGSTAMVGVERGRARFHRHQVGGVVEEVNIDEIEGRRGCR